MGRPNATGHRSSRLNRDFVFGSDAEIDEILTEQGHGILSVTKNDSAYGIPISFGYDGERVFMHLLEFGGESKKAEFMETHRSVTRRRRPEVSRTRSRVPSRSGASSRRRQ